LGLPLSQVEVDESLSNETLEVLKPETTKGAIASQKIALLKKLEIIKGLKC
jgi:hypothetical protein